MKWLRDNVWLLPLAVANVVIRAYGIADPWLRGHRGFSGALSGIISRNYLRFGYLETRFAPVWLSGPASPQDLAANYHLRHPSLRYLVISLLYRVLGVSEWVTSLMPILSSLGTAIVLYLLVKRVWGKWTAVLALAFLSIVPIDAYYGNMASHESMAMFFALLGLLLYHHWLEKPSRALLIGLLAALGLGAFAGYAGFYMLGAIGLHFLLVRPWQWSTVRFTLALGVFAVALFGGWVLYAAWLLGSPSTFLAGWDLRTGSGDSAQFTFGAWYLLEYMRTRDFFTPTLRLMAVVWGLFLLRDVLRGRDWQRHGYLGVLLLFGLPQVVVFRQGVWVHEYWLMFLTPFFAVAAAAAVAQIGREWLGGRKLLIGALVLVVWAFYAPEAVGQLQAFYQPRDAGETRLAQRLHDRTELNEGILLGFEVLQPHFDYYLDRQTEEVTDLEGFEEAFAGGRFRFCVLRTPRTVDEKLVQTLARTYPVQTFEDYLIFDLKGAGDRLVRDGLPLEQVNAVGRQIAPGIELVGYSGPPAVRLNDPPDPGWLHNYLHSTAYQPEPTWRQLNVTLYWRAGPNLKGDAQPAVQLVGSDGKERYRLEPKWAPVLATYSTGLWRPGEVVAAPYCFELNEDDPATVYRLELVGKSESDTVLLGQIAVERGPASKGVAARPTGATLHELAASAGNGVDLVGYATERETYTAGETLDLRTVWQSNAAGDATQDPMPGSLAASACLQDGDYEICRAIGVIGGPDWAPGEFYEREVALPLHPAMLAGRYDVVLKVGGEPWQTIKLGQVDVKEKKRVWRVYDDGAADYAGDRQLKPDDAFRVKYTLNGPAAVRLVVNWTGRAELTQTRVEAYRVDEGGGSEEFLGTREIHRGAPSQSEWVVPKKLALTGSNVLELRVAKEAEGIHRLGWRGWLERWLPDLLDESVGPRAGPIQIDALDVERDWADGWPAYWAAIQLYAQQKMWPEAAQTYEEAAQKGISPQSVEEVSQLQKIAQASGLDSLTAQTEKDLERLIPNQVGVSFGGKLRLEGYDFRRSRGKLDGRLYWRALGKVDQDWTLWLHVVPADPATLAALGAQERAAGYVSLDQRLDTHGWEPGQLVVVRVSRSLPAGRYEMKLGLWRSEDGSRLFRDDRPDEHELSLDWAGAK
jgi:hypothetical protein